MKIRTLSIASLFLAVCFVSIILVSEAKALLSSHECADCHSVMGASGSTLLNDVSVEVLCLVCHSSANGNAAAVDVHTNGSNSYAPFRVTCLGCHDPHDNRGYDADNDGVSDGTNIKLVGVKLDSSGLAKIDTPNTIHGTLTSDVAFEVRGKPNKNSPVQSLHSFADGDEDGDGDYDGICEVCHTQTVHHRKDNSGGDHTHHVGEICTDCHSHINGFNK